MRSEGYSEFSQSSILTPHSSILLYLHASQIRDRIDDMVVYSILLLAIVAEENR